MSEHRDRHVDKDLEQRTSQPNVIREIDREGVQPR